MRRFRKAFDEERRVALVGVEAFFASVVDVVGLDTLDLIKVAAANLLDAKVRKHVVEQLTKLRFAARKFEFNHRKNGKVTARLKQKTKQKKDLIVVNKSKRKEIVFFQKSTYNTVRLGAVAGADAVVALGVGAREQLVLEPHLAGLRKRL